MSFFSRLIRLRQTAATFCGKMRDERYLHVVAGMLEENMIIITTYLPSHDKWETPVKRRKN